jgi:hypothetical protein
VKPPQRWSLRRFFFAPAESDFSLMRAGCKKMPAG